MPRPYPSTGFPVRASWAGMPRTQPACPALAHRSLALPTVVSEFMCQQTQVATVLPYFAAWMELFPDFASLAAAQESAVLRALGRVWANYSRALNLFTASLAGG